jgi:uncharacterized protein
MWGTRMSLALVFVVFATNSIVVAWGGNPSTLPSGPQATTQPTSNVSDALAALDKARARCIARLQGDENYRIAVAAEKDAEQLRSGASDDDRADAAAQLLAARTEVYKIESAAFASNLSVAQAQKDLNVARIVANRVIAVNNSKDAATSVPAVQRNTVAPIPAGSFLDTQFVFPGSAAQGQKAAILQPIGGCELVTLRAHDGTRIVALFGKAPFLPVRGVRPALLYFYGNGMCMAYSLAEFGGFRSLGFNVIMVDYEGYGMSGGAPSEAGCYAAADAAYDYLLTRKDIDPTGIVATGWSLGAAVAIDLASRRRVAGLVTFSAFTNIPDVSASLLNGFPLGIVLLRSRFDNLAKISSVPCPILLVHGSLDSLVPPEMQGRLAKSARSTVTTFRVADAGHNDIFQQGGEALYQRVRAFVDELSDVSTAVRPR